MQRTAASSKRNAAAATIQRAWVGYKSRQVFRLLKATLSAAEHSLTREILRKLAPKEADFFSRDESFLRLKVRFRFGGSEFPPSILYKIYVDAAGGHCKVKYVNGKGTIRAETEAAAQSAKMMGNRKFYDIMLQDGLMRLQHGVADETDVVTVKDLMRLTAVTDETQPELGGKANTWRQLTSQSAPRHTVFRDVIDYLATRRLTDRLRRCLPLLTALPSSQEVRREQLRVLAEVEAPRLTAEDRQRRQRRLPARVAGTSRRSSRAVTRSQKMREAYMQHAAAAAPAAPAPAAPIVDSEKASVGLEPSADGMDRWFRSLDRSPRGDAEDEEEEGGVEEGNFYDDDVADEEEEDFEEEADMLYEWSRELTEGQLGSPRLG